MMPSYYGYEEIGNALRELGATGIFVDNDVYILDEIKTLFPEFDVKKGDALTFQEEGVITTVHYRPMVNYPHETARPFPKYKMYGPGFEKMVQNISKLSPNFVLLSIEDKWAIDEEKNALEKAKFKIKEEGIYNSLKVMRYNICEKKR